MTNSARFEVERPGSEDHRAALHYWLEWTTPGGGQCDRLVAAADVQRPSWTGEEMQAALLRVVAQDAPHWQRAQVRLWRGLWPDGTPRRGEVMWDLNRGDWRAIRLQAGRDVVARFCAENGRRETRNVPSFKVWAEQQGTPLQDESDIEAVLGRIFMGASTCTRAAVGKVNGRQRQAEAAAAHNRAVGRAYVAALRRGEVVVVETVRPLNLSGDERDRAHARVLVKRARRRRELAELGLGEG